jgi:hypothetical protein
LKYKRTLLVIIVALIVSVSFIGCKKEPTETNELGDVPPTSSTTYSEPEQTEPSETISPEELEEWEVAGDRDTGIEISPDVTPAPIGPQPTEEWFPDVELNPASPVTLGSKMDKPSFGLEISLPEGYTEVDSTAVSARYQKAGSTLEFSLFVRTNVAAGTKINDTRVAFYNMKSLIKYTPNEMPYETWDMGYREFVGDLEIDGQKVARDILEIIFLDKEEYSLFTPYSLASYFYLNGNAYILLGISDYEDALVVEAMSDEIIRSIDASETAADTTFLSSTETMIDEANKVSFEIPVGWERIDNPSAIVLRPGESAGEEQKHLQITCFKPTSTFTDAPMAPYVIQDLIGATYRIEPFKRTWRPTNEVSVTGYKDIPFTLLQRSVNRYEIKSVLNALSDEDEAFIQSNGVIDSLLYTFETSSGKAYAINVSGGPLNTALRDQLAELINKTIKLT